MINEKNTVPKKFYCLHCNVELLNDQESFCCKGCQTAFDIINKNGFINFYSSRLLATDSSSLKPDNNLNFSPQEFINFDPQTMIYSLNLVVHGLHCGACVWLIENLLSRQEDVVKSRVNLTLKTLEIQWRGTAEYGNDLTGLIEKIGYKLLPADANAVAEFEKRFDDKIFKAMAVAGFGAGNIMLFSFALWFDIDFKITGATRQFLHFISTIIALPVLIYSGRIFFVSAINSLKARVPNMDIPIAMAIILASAVSLLETIRGGKIIYFDSAVMLVFFLLIGRYLDLKARKIAFDIATKFSQLQVGFGRVLIDNKIKILPINKIQEGMVIIVASGEKIASDGIVIEGESAVDNSLISGESIPEKISINSIVFGGSINIDSTIKVKITANQNNSILANIINYINHIQIKKNFYIRIADKFSLYYTPAVHIVAFLTFIGWFYFLKSGWNIALMNATAVLIITCPCALALAIPIVQTIAISNFLKKGIIVKSGEALEKINQIDYVIFDKTGSITEGKPILQNIFEIKNNQFDKLSDEDHQLILKLAGNLGKYSKHPLSQSLAEQVGNQNLINQAEEIKAQGLVGNYASQPIKMGNAQFCEIKNYHQIQDKEPQIFGNQSKLRTFIQYDNRQFILLFSDQIKEGAIELIQYLKSINKEIILLSGDYQDEVEKVAKNLNIENFYYQKKPLEKAEILQDLLNQRKKIMMIGDGLNDAPALAMSSVSLSFSKAVDISQNIADIIINSSNLRQIIFVIKYSKRTLKTMKENLILAILYNVIAIPFAIMGIVSPLIAAIAMSSSSLMVTINSLKINKKIL
jgi:Cu2+-exporting ATPase